NSVAEQINAHSEPETVTASEYEQYGHLLEETLDSDSEAYSDFIVADNSVVEPPQPEAKNSDVAEFHDETDQVVAPGKLNDPEDTSEPPAPNTT
ncbi:hypothetical protein, partial [Enterobacter hormaechei]